MTKGSLGAVGYAFPTLVGIDGADLNQRLAGRRRGGVLHDESAGTLDCPALPAPGQDLRFNYRYLGTVPQCQELCSGSRYAGSHSDTFPDLVKLPESFGINGLRAEHPDGVDGLIAQVLAPSRPGAGRHSGREVRERVPHDSRRCGLQRDGSFHRKRSPRRTHRRRAWCSSESAGPCHTPATGTNDRCWYGCGTDSYRRRGAFGCALARVPPPTVVGEILAQTT